MAKPLRPSTAESAAILQLQALQCGVCFGIFVSWSFAFTPVAGVQSCAGCHLLFKGKQPNVTDVLFYLVFLVGNLNRTAVSH